LALVVLVVAQTQTEPLETRLVLLALTLLVAVLVVGKVASVKLR
jgi:hypothetical protein